ncbi:PDZ domain-containing protein [Candidatus Amarolinea dominans]|uniref:PDZ domain-containing protein n=1 Tax=Candidatus Amarolinea dominans TaxID=3140696 RepID=UPI0031375CF0|nr:PDZ domain-containing protein [Anaerolineae bacterium]
MNENNSSRNRIVLIAAVAVIALCLVAAVSAAIGGVAGFAIGRNRQTIEIQRTLTPDDSRRPNQQTPGDQMPMGPGVMGMNGAMIREVVADGPAANAGLQAGDLITAVGNKKLDQGLTLAEAIAAYKPGDQVEITFRRSADEQTVTVTLGQHPDDAAKPYLGLTFITMPMRQTPGQ